jgi:hypothetical protein
VSFWYGRKQALKDVSLKVYHHEVTALIGPSGCGKTTLLRSTRWSGQGGGELCAARLGWLEATLAEKPSVATLILMHQPPFLTGIAHMDRRGHRPPGRRRLCPEARPGEGYSLTRKHPLLRARTTIDFVDCLITVNAAPGRYPLRSRRNGGAS